MQKKRKGEEANLEAAQAYRRLGALVYLNDTKGALEAYEKSVDLDPDGWNQLGRLFQRSGDHESAESFYSKALKLDAELGRKEGMAIQFGNLGSMRYIDDDLEGAEEYWKKSLSLFTEIGAKPMIEKVQSWLDKLADDKIAS